MEAMRVLTEVINVHCGDGEESEEEGRVETIELFDANIAH